MITIIIVYTLQICVLLTHECKDPSLGRTPFLFSKHLVACDSHAGCMQMVYFQGVCSSGT